MRHKSGHSKAANKEGTNGNNGKNRQKQVTGQWKVFYCFEILENGASADTNTKAESNASPLLNDTQANADGNNSAALFANLDSKVSLEPAIDVDLINKKLPKELLIRIFSYLDIITLCRCAQVSKVCPIELELVLASTDVSY